MAGLTVLGVLKPYLKYCNLYALLSIFVPFFGVLIIYKGGSLMPPVSDAYLAMESDLADMKKGGYAGEGFISEADSGDAGGD